MIDQPTMRETLAKKLAEYRKTAGLTVYEVGEKIGKSGKTVSGWEHCVGQPDAGLLAELCKLYQINIADLFDMPPKGITMDEDYMISLYRQLNLEGQEVIKNTAIGLINSGRYKP